MRVRLSGPWVFSSPGLYGPGESHGGRVTDCAELVIERTSGRRRGGAEAEEGGAVRGVVVFFAGGTAVLSIREETAPNDPVPGVAIVSVLAPLKNIPVHIMEAELVGLLLTHWMGELAAVIEVPPHVVQVASAGVWPWSPSSAGILPLCRRW